jgi:hypothetical protein
MHGPYTGAGGSQHELTFLATGIYGKPLLCQRTVKISHFKESKTSPWTWEKRVQWGMANVLKVLNVVEDFYDIYARG